LQGFETISGALSLATLLLAFYPEVQDKIFEELQSVFCSVDEEVTDEHLKQLTYLDLVIKEVMRFWTPVPHIARSLNKDMELGESFRYFCLCVLTVFCSF
jgi:cytochrome P450